MPRRFFVVVMLVALSAAGWWVSAQAPAGTGAVVFDTDPTFNNSIKFKASQTDRFAYTLDFATAATANRTIDLQKGQVVSGSGATVTLAADQCGATVLLDRAAGIVFTLPAPSAGCRFSFYTPTTVTSNNYKLSTATQGTDFFVGGYTNVDTDTSNAVAAFTCDGATHDNFTMNGTTTGGIKGTVITVTAISTTLWSVEGMNLGSGTVATACATS